MTTHTLRRIGGRPIPDTPGEIRACMVVRNEQLRLASALDHHRKLGVGRFLVVDNGSDDGTLEFLEAQTDVHLFSTTDSFAESDHGLSWINTIFDQYADGYWVLTVDADELFIYPRYEQIPLPRFCGFLDSMGARAVFSLMLDMYSDRPLDRTVHDPGSSLMETCAYFDRGPYRSGRLTAFPYTWIRGGVRDRLFRQLDGGRTTSPVVSKVPLVKWAAGARYLVSTHEMTDMPMSDLTAGLLHFKFLNDFHERARIEVARAEHYHGALEYQAYLDILRSSGPLNLMAVESVRFEDSAQLVAMGLMRTSSAYERFATALA